MSLQQTKYKCPANGLQATASLNLQKYQYWERPICENVLLQNGIHTHFHSMAMYITNHSIYNMATVNNKNIMTKYNTHNGQPLSDKYVRLHNNETMSYGHRTEQSEGKAGRVRLVTSETKKATHTVMFGSSAHSVSGERRL